MIWANYDDVLGQLQAAGLDVVELDIDTTRPVRCRESDGGREKRGWYWLTTKRIGDADYATGAFGIYHGDDSGKRVVKINRDGKAVQIDKAEREAIAARQREHMKRLKAMRQAEIDRAAAEAAACWRKYVEQGESDYLQRKGVAAHGLRFSPSGNGTVAVPMMDPTGAVHGLQIIRGKNRGAKREKEYWPAGLSKVGHYHLIGGLPTWVVIVAEGYATAASIFEATGLPVAVAFDAGNLIHVAQVLHGAWPRCKILIAADDDAFGKCIECSAPVKVVDPICPACGKEHKRSNAGVTGASNAAHAVGGSWVAPRFAAERNKKGPNDFNDLHALEGIATVRAQIQTHLAGLGWVAPEPRARDTAHQGGGEARRAQAVMPLEDAVERFVPLDDGTGKYLFDTWTNRVCLKDQMIAVLPAGVRWDDVKRHPVWADRGAYFLHEVGFDPAGDDRTVLLNTWKGWPMQPKAGSCDRMLELLRYLCSGEDNADEVFDWLICWMAYPLQNPGAKMSSAVIMHGPQGTGKSTIFQALAKIYGDYSTVLNQRGLEDKFNSDWSDSKLFILAEEVVTRAEMWHIKNELKELVTGEWIRINPKNIAAYRQRNHLNIVYLSNETQPLPLENDDRRHLVVWTPPQLSESFYDEVFLEMEQGGVEAFYQYLLDIDLSAKKFHPKKKPPMTESKRKLIDLSAPSEARFCTDYLAGDTPWPIGPALSDDFYAAYLRWCRINGENRPRPSNQFFGSVARMPGWEKSKRRVYEDCTFTGKTKPKPVVIPPRAALQTVGMAQAPGGDDAQWLTRHVHDFHHALAEKGADKWAA